MASIRRALLLATAGRYAVMLVNVAAMAITARLLTPSDFGVAALGGAVIAMAEAVRELGSVAYLVQQTEITVQKIRTVFTISLIVTALLVIILIASAEPVAHIYGDERLIHFLRILALGFAIGPFMHPIYALLSREMRFGQLAVIDITSVIVSNTATVVLAIFGFGFISIGWGSVASAVAGVVLGLTFRRDFSVYRPLLTEWRMVVRFGTYGSATAVLYRSSEALSFLLLGRLLTVHAVGLIQRAALLSMVAERVILAGIGAVALPAFSEQARQGRDLKASYLLAIEYVTAIQWPALMVLAVFADTIVMMVLGPQWHEIVPIVRIFAIAFMFNFPTSLNYPLQVAASGIQYTVPLAILHAAVSLSVLMVATPYGLEAAAIGSLITIPTNVFISVCLVKYLVPFDWIEFFRAQRHGFVVTIASLLGPLSISYLTQDESMTILAGLLAIVLSGLGWTAGLFYTKHPLINEIGRMHCKIKDKIYATIGRS